MTGITREHQRLIRDVLRASSAYSDVFLHPNVVGHGFHGVIRHQLRHLAERGPEALARGYEAVLHRNRVTYGLGVGSPDIIGHVGGRFLGLEAKTGKARRNPEQRKWHDIERRRGAVVEVIRSVGDMHEVVRGMQ